MTWQVAQQRLVRSGILLLLAAVGLCVLAGAASAQTPGEATVAVEPTEQQVTVGETTTLDVVVQNATAGVSSYTTSIELNSSSAAILGVEVPDTGDDGPLVSGPTFSSDNTSISFGAALLDGTLAPADEVTIASLTVAVEKPGAVEATAVNGTVLGENPNVEGYDITDFVGGVVTGVESTPDTPASVSVRPTEQQVTVGETTTLDLVVENATRGVSSYETTVELNRSTASIVDYEVASSGGTGPLVSADFGADNSSVSLDVALLNGTLPAGEEVSIASLTVAVEEPGAVAATPVDTTVADDDGVQFYDITELSGGVVTGVEPTVASAVAVRPAQQAVTVGSETTVDVVVTNATMGVSAYEIDLGLNSSGASIVDYELTADGQTGPLDNSRISADNASISLDVALLDAAQQPADAVTVAELTVAVDDRGAVELAPTQAAVIGTESREYSLGLTGGVIEGDGLPPIVGDTPPADPDGDGLYEDIRGNGDVGVLDVQTLFNSIEASVVQDNARAFDFSDSDPTDEVTVLDVQALFIEATSGGDDPDPAPGPEPTFASTDISNDNSSVECTSVGAFGACAGNWEQNLNVTAAYTLDDPSGNADRVVVSVDPSDGDAANRDLTDSVSGPDASGALDYASSWADPIAGRNCNIDVAVTYRVYDDGTVTDTVQDSATIDLGCDNGGDSDNLTVTGVSAPASVSSGSFTATATVKNNAEETRTEYLYLYVDGSYNEYLGSVTLDPGETTTVSDEVTVDRSDAPSITVKVKGAGSASTTVSVNVDPMFASTDVSNDNSSVECTVFGFWDTCVGAWKQNLNVTASYTLDDPSNTADRVEVFVDPDDGDAAEKTLTDFFPGGSGTLNYASSWSDPVSGRNCNIDVGVTYRVYDDGNVTDTVQEAATIDLCSGDDDPEGPEEPELSFASTELSNDNSSVECNSVSTWGGCAGAWNHTLNVDASYALSGSSEDANKVTATFTPSDGDAATKTLTDRSVSEDDASGTLDYSSSWADQVAGRSCNIDMNVTYRVYDDGNVADTAQDSAAIDMGC